MPISSRVGRHQNRSVGSIWPYRHLRCQREETLKIFRTKSSIGRSDWLKWLPSQSLLLPILDLILFYMYVITPPLFSSICTTTILLLYGYIITLSSSIRITFHYMTHMLFFIITSSYICMPYHWSIVITPPPPLICFIACTGNPGAFWLISPWKPK